MRLSELQPRVVRLLEPERGGRGPEPVVTDEERRALRYAITKKWRDRNRAKRNAMDRRWRQSRRENNPTTQDAGAVSEREA